MYRTTNFITKEIAFRSIGFAALALGLFTILSSVLAYFPSNPDFSILSTFLSDIGDTAGWPQILFNSGMLIVSPLRYLVLVLLVIRLKEIGDNKVFNVAVLTIGAISTIGTILMTAVPFSIALNVHKTGIGFYFLGVTILQIIIGTKEFRLKELPRILSGLSFGIVFLNILFLIFFILYQVGNPVRSITVILEWFSAFMSLFWLFGHSIVLGREYKK